MKLRIFALVVCILGIPALAFAASMEGGRSYVLSEPSANNTYLYGGDVTVAAPVAADLTIIAGNITVSSPISGDVLATGGTVMLRKPVEGDVRVVGGKVDISDTVNGDVVAAGGTVSVSSTPRMVWVIGGLVSLNNGAHGPVTAYGGTVLLNGTFDGDVTVIASDRIDIAEGTHIQGHLYYDAPQQIALPQNTVVDGGVTYTGKTFLPTSEEAKTFAIAGAGIFFLVRILAVIIAAGLLAGLFPLFTQHLAHEVAPLSTRRFLLTTLLGFAVLVAAPILILLLLLSIAGSFVAIVLAAAYVLLLILSYLSAAIITGVFLVRVTTKRTVVFWRDAVIGMLLLSLVALIPVVGGFIVLIMLAATMGILVRSFYHMAFTHE